MRYGSSGYRVDIEFAESNADNFLVKREALGPSASRYKMSAAESLEVDGSNTDHIILTMARKRHLDLLKRASAGPSSYAFRHKRAAPTSMEAE